MTQNCANASAVAALFETPLKELTGKAHVTQSLCSQITIHTHNHLFPSAKHAEGLYKSGIQSVAALLAYPLYSSLAFSTSFSRS